MSNKSIEQLRSEISQLELANERLNSDINHHNDLLDRIKQGFWERYDKLHSEHNNIVNNMYQSIHENDLKIKSLKAQISNLTKQKNRKDN